MIAHDIHAVYLTEPKDTLTLPVTPFYLQCVMPYRLIAIGISSVFNNLNKCFSDVPYTAVRLWEWIIDALLPSFCAICHLLQIVRPYMV